MRDISVKVLNPEAARFGEKMMVCGARMTQRGHNIKTMDDFMKLYNKSYLSSTMETMNKLRRDASSHKSPVIRTMCIISVQACSILTTVTMLPSVYHMN